MLYFRRGEPMVAFPLFDSILSQDSSSRSLEAAAQFVQAALSELEQIEKLDDSLAPENPIQFDRRTAALLRNEYERWARETASLLERIDRFERDGGSVA